MGIFFYLPDYVFVMTFSLHCVMLRKITYDLGDNMNSTQQASQQRDTLNLRISPTERNLIDLAAASTGQTRTSFVLGAARRAAEETLLDRSVLSVSEEAYIKFLDRLNAPAQPNELLRRTMQTPLPWKID